MRPALRVSSLVALTLSVAVSAPGGEGKAPRHASGETAMLETESAPRIEILPLSERRSGRLRVETLVTSPEIRRVEFRLDGELIDADDRFPFTTALDETTCRGRQRLEAVGLSATGAELTRDALLLGQPDAELSVSIDAIRTLPSPGWLEVTAAVELPAGSSLDRLDFYRGSRYAGSVSAPPFRLRIPGCTAAPYLRAVAQSSDGRIAEAVRLLEDTGPVEALSVNLVEIYAMVSDRAGRPVPGLARSAFELRFAGEPWPIERFSEGDAVPLSLALVIDSSGSMYESMARAEQSAEHFLGQLLDPGDEALVVDFDERPRLLAGPTGNVDRLIASFAAVTPEGASAIYDGIAFALLELERAGGRKALVVITDGHDSGSRLTEPECARLARRLGVPIFVLRHGVVPRDRPSHAALALAELADETGGALHDIQRPDDLEVAYEAIENQLRGQYLLAFEADDALSSADLEALDVRVSDPRLRVRTILGGQVHLAD